MIRVRFVAAAALCALATACSSPTLVRTTDPGNERVVEGTVVSASLHKSAITTLTNTVAGGVASSQGSTVLGVAALAIDLLDTAAQERNSYTLEMVVLNDETQQEEPLVFKHVMHNRTTPSVGDRVRIIFRKNGGQQIANLTKHPKLDALTR